MFTSRGRSRRRCETMASGAAALGRIHAGKHGTALVGLAGALLSPLLVHLVDLPGSTDDSPEKRNISANGTEGSGIQRCVDRDIFGKAEYVRGPNVVFCDPEDRVHLVDLSKNLLAGHLPIADPVGMD